MNFKQVHLNYVSACSIGMYGNKACCSVPNNIKLNASLNMPIIILLLWLANLKNYVQWQCTYF